MPTMLLAVQKIRGTPVEPCISPSEPMGWDVYDHEVHFRMHRARSFYPDFIGKCFITGIDTVAMFIGQ